MKKVIPSSVSLGTISIKESIKSIVYDIINNFSLKVNSEDLDTLISYLAYYGYYIFAQDIFSYQDQLIVVVYSNDDKKSYIKFDTTLNTIVFIEDTIITDFTNKERTNVIYTPIGKCIVYTFNGFNTSIYFSPASSKRIKIGSDRALNIPEDLKPDDIKDYSDNPTDFYKVLSEANYAKLIKINYEISSDILT